MLEGKCVVIGITGGIAAYKSAELAHRLKKRGADVRVIMTKNACRFIAPLTLETLTGNPVAVDTFERPKTWEVEHIALAKRADIFVIAPATANIIAKLACGLADDMLSTTALATKAPMLVCPAMNTGMLDNPATVANIALLKSRGIAVMESGEGILACGDSGRGRMPEPSEIERRVIASLTRVRDMEGMKVLVTAGPTCESLDPVRFITNRSSGRMGFAVAQMAAERGADVTLVHGKVSIPVPPMVTAVPVVSTGDLYREVLSRCESADIVIQAAAPADYRAAEIAPQKIKKQDGGKLVLELVENPDIAKAVGQRKREGQILVGFAAETQNVYDNARKKLASKSLDLIVANDVTKKGAGFDVETNIAAFITKDGIEELPLQLKTELADKLLSKAVELKSRA
ncbi:MAG: bifunctional phosphopantothenoylcysteine decarboxylase/phosphopantothenate--cysteine ligase CoaBC [Eubacteriales bacterium]|nr:bifunctional phosphopantothenoylcysteine decarboxylase/phosphopantothenate--cysteine ligase CoaBC [Eubacteriales bacterium]MDD3880832.1 bifunctional phosphopantothenoylcysteine decarboxylase/phosphopantothenate--cysteine ligase CoaBC [Eubacteriales bacterium]MDD4511801.1 bifunctional phosphopantothenoylcysteine decarboxylase/phosphopantothenate--cysteine ligase CoaBC [Eubacteriales bacterium]